MSHLRLDDQKQRLVEDRVKDLNKQKIQDYCEFHLKQQNLLEDDTLDPTNWEKQKGFALHENKLLEILRKINPNFKIIAVLGNPHVKRLLLDTPEFGSKDQLGHPKQVCLIMAGEMPEYSFFNYKYEEVPITEIAVGARALTKDELPESTLLYDPDTKQYKLQFDPTKPRPGFKNVKKPWREVIRGWRSVIAHIVGAGICSPEQIEPLLPTYSGRESWAAKMGKAGNPINRF